MEDGRAGNHATSVQINRRHKHVSSAPRTPERLPSEGPRLVTALSTVVSCSRRDVASLWRRPSTRPHSPPDDSPLHREQEAGRGEGWRYQSHRRCRCRNTHARPSRDAASPSPGIEAARCSFPVRAHYETDMHYRLPSEHGRVWVKWDHEWVGVPCSVSWKNSTTQTPGHAERRGAKARARTIRRWG